MAAHHPGQSLAWLVHREHPCFDGPGPNWDCAAFANAATRAAAADIAFQSATVLLAIAGALRQQTDTLPAIEMPFSFDLKQPSRTGFVSHRAIARASLGF